jgi:tetratricopeptide (TPR) repeat protein
VALYKRAKAYQASRDCGRALEDYDRAIELKPDYFAAHINPKLATSLFGRGVAKSAHGDCRSGEADMAAAKKRCRPWPP